MYLICFIANNIYMMIYIIGFLSGVLNGMFASGAGQIIVLYLVFFKKNDSHISRNISLSMLSIASILTIILHLNFVDVNVFNLFIVFIISVIGGLIGNNLMNKVESKVLNLIGGIIICSLSVYGVINL